MPVCSIVKLLPLGTLDDLMHFCTRPSASFNSAPGRPRHLGVIVLTMLQTGMKVYNSFPNITLRQTLFRAAKVHAWISAKDQTIPSNEHAYQTVSVHILARTLTAT